MAKGNDEQATEKSKRERAKKKKRLEISGCGGLVVCFELRDEGKVLGKARMLG